MAETRQLEKNASDMLRQCRTALASMGTGLSSVMKDREQDFLALGENLMSLQSGCEELSQNSGELVECTSGQGMQARLESLSAELTALVDVRGHDAGRKSLGEIDGVARIVGELSGIVSAFSKIVKHLSMLGIATRIESARLGADGRGFSTLADDVEKLAQLIVEHCGGISVKVGALRGHVDSARDRTQAIVKAQENCFDVISRELGANIAGLGTMTAASAALSQELSQSAEAIASDIGAAVRSLQSHDIVRQQIEHAEHAIEEMDDLLAAEGDTGQGNPLEMLAFAADVLTLQASQLDSANRHFSTAAVALRDSLDSLARRIRGIGEAISGLGGGAGGAKGGPLAKLQAGIATVKDELGDFAAQGEALGGIMDSVADTIADMGGSIEAIEEVGSEIELIAINASIKAAHTGEAGAALGVLALAIQHLSMEARHQTDAVAGILRDIAEASRALQENASRYNDQSEAWRVVGELDTVLSETSVVADRSETLFGALKSASVMLGSRAVDVARGINFDKEIGRRLVTIGRALEEQAAKGRTLAPGGGQGRSDRLRALYDRYTMETERDVHEAAFGAAGPSADSGRAIAAEKTGEFGDNVELF